MKNLALLLALVAPMLIMSSCSDDDDNENNGGSTTSHEYVDLGLPSGTLWATCNIGANNPEEFGDYFAWGETEPYCTSASYKHGNLNDKQLTKYCTNSNYGTVDNKIVLEAEDDAATANWGSNWRMPTIEECTELINSSYTITKQTTQGSVKGYLITSKSNGNSIFMPMNLDSDFKYWSSSLYSNYVAYAWILGIAPVVSSPLHVSQTDRDDGCSIRPVRNK